MQENQNTSIIEIRVIFRGNVQGVGFRATTQHYATQLGLKGTVRNCSDGSVEAYLQGPDQRIQQLLQLIQSKMGHKEISGLDKQKISPLNIYQGFKIISSDSF